MYHQLHYLNLSLDSISEIIDGKLYVEEWRPVVGYEQLYHVSSFGRIKRLSRVLKTNSRVIGEFIVSQRFSGGRKSKQYLTVTLRRNGNGKKFFVHRLVGFSFLDRIDGKDHINHITGIKTVNHFSKLEWCTPQENNEHGVALGLLKRGRKIKPYIKKGRRVGVKKIINTDNGEIIEHATELSNRTGWSLKKIRRILTGVRYNNTPYRYLGEEERAVLPPAKEKIKTPVAVFDGEWNFIKSFDYKEEAAKYVGCAVDTINHVINGKQSSAYGFKFKNIDKDGSFAEPKLFVSKKKPPKPKKEKGARTPSKAIMQYNMGGELVKIFPSIGATARELNVDKKNFTKMIKKSPRNFYKGFVYKIE